MEDRADLAITDAPDEQRFEARLGGRLVGFAQYRRAADHVVYPYVKVEPAYEGRGIGGALTRVALDDARTRGLAVVPRCPFVARWMDLHPEYADLRYRGATGG